MKKKRKGTERPGARTATLPEPKAGRRVWPYLAGIAAATLTAFVIYGPALHGPFVLDDIYLPFTSQTFAYRPLTDWIRGVRPLLMFTFWLNFRTSELDPYSYHLLNVLLHVANSALLFFIVRRLATWAGMAGRRLEIVSAFAAALFLVHPVQTESVTYIASRSETLCLTFVYGALVVFLHHGRPVSWRAASAILALYLAAISTKEHAVALMGVFLLTDYFFNPGFSLTGIRRNWRLYVPAALAGGAGAFWVLHVLRHADTAGFSVPGVKWYEYLFTQFRVIWRYVRLVVLPYGQTLDPDVPLSRSLFDHGAIVGLAALIALTAAAIVWRRRYPLAAYGWLVFLVLLAPTSSVVPILDPSAEHRIYLPLIGLALMAAEGLRRVRVSDWKLAGLLAALLFAYGAAAQARNLVWNSTISLWEDAARKAPGKYRPHFQLAFAYYKAGRCADAIREYEAAWNTGTHDGPLLADWGLAYDCNNQPEQAISKLRESTVLMKNGHTYSLIGALYGKLGRTQEALDVLAAGEAVDPGAENIYVIRGHVLRSVARFAEAAAQYRRALAINPHNESAAQGLAIIESRAAGAR